MKVLNGSPAFRLGLIYTLVDSIGRILFSMHATRFVFSIVFWFFLLVFIHSAN